MAFPPPHVVEPKEPHTHTIVLLHGRASNGAEFAEELFETTSSNDKSLAQHFPHCRWVLPTSRDRWSSVFQEDLTAWFDVYSLTNPCDEERQSLQVEGLRESMLFLLEVLRREVEILDGQAQRLVLGGMSQGMAVGLWALLCSPGRRLLQGRGKGFGGFLGMCGWLPFANRVEDLLSKPPKGTATEGQRVELKIPDLLLGIIGNNNDIDMDIYKKNEEDIEAMLSTPVLLLHGTDDAFVDIELGRQAYRCLTRAGMEVGWYEFSGADNEGHWIKQPEGVDAVVQFLGTVLQG